MINIGRILGKAENYKKAYLFTKPIYNSILCNLSELCYNKAQTYSLISHCAPSPLKSPAISSYPRII